MQTFDHGLWDPQRSISVLAPNRIIISEYKYARLVLKDSSDSIWTEVPHDSNVRHGVVRLIEKQ